jgi:hypothetical protein
MGGSFRLPLRIDEADGTYDVLDADGNIVTDFLFLTRAAAEQTILALNSHDALVATVKLVLERLVGGWAEGSWDDVLRQIEAAIAAAEGREA